MRSEAADWFGTEPGPGLEERILAVFTTHPQLVKDAIQHVGEAWNAGRVRSPWVVVAIEAEKRVQLRENAGRLKIVSSEEPQRILNTRILIRNNIYLHEDLDLAEDEIIAALGPYAEEPKLLEAMLELWRERRAQVGWG